MLRRGILLGAKEWDRLGPGGGDDDLDLRERYRRAPGSALGGPSAQDETAVSMIPVVRNGRWKNDGGVFEARQRVRCEKRCAVAEYVYHAVVRCEVRP